MSFEGDLQTKRAAVNRQSQHRMPAAETAAFRRALNSQGAMTDVGAMRLASRMLLLFLYFRTWRIEGDWALVLIGASHSLLCEALALLCVLRPATYIKHREVLYTALVAHMAWLCRFLVVNGHLNIFTLHRGSALMLLFMFLVGNSALYLALYLLHARLPARWCLGAAPLLALYPLSTSHSMCRRVLDAPGVAEPLHRLHAIIASIHAALIHMPPPALPPLTAEQAPMAHCLAVNCWSTVLCGVALTLAGLCVMERQSWQLYLKAQRRRGAGGWQGGAAAAEDEEWAQQQLWPALPLSGSWGLDLFCLSSLVWSATLVALL